MIVLVRHAEKVPPGTDGPPLTAAGAERARALAVALKDAGVTAIITSDVPRTIETAKPLADARGLKSIVVGGGEAHIAAVAAEVRRHAGGVVLVVGHSNTIPGIIAALGVPGLKENIPDQEFANLYTLVPVSGGMRLVHSRYGAPDPGPLPPEQAVPTPRH
jgi:broad specificity phosphatase PhoE